METIFFWGYTTSMIGFQFSLQNLELIFELA